MYVVLQFLSFRFLVWTYNHEIEMKEFISLYCNYLKYSSGKPASYKTETKPIDCCEKGSFKSVSCCSFPFCFSDQKTG